MIDKVAQLMGLGDTSRGSGTQHMIPTLHIRTACVMEMIWMWSEETGGSRWVAEAAFALGPRSGGRMKATFWRQIWQI